MKDSNYNRKKYRYKRVLCLFVMIMASLIFFQPKKANAAWDESYKFIIEDGVLTEYLGDDWNVVIPDGVKAIAPLTFWNKGVVELVIPNTVTEIGYGAFEGCTSLS